MPPRILLMLPPALGVGAALTYGLIAMPRSVPPYAVVDVVALVALFPPAWAWT